MYRNQPPPHVKNGQSISDDEWTFLGLNLSNSKGFDSITDDEQWPHYFYLTNNLIESHPMSEYSTQDYN